MDTKTAVDTSSISIVRVYVSDDRRIIIGSNGLDRGDNLSLNIFRDDDTEIMFNGRRYRYLGKSLDSPIPGTSRRGTCKFYSVESI